MNEDFEVVDFSVIARAVGEVMGKKSRATRTRIVQVKLRVT